jgi:prepilin-type N-terminal cleavage/methylation domain-containing protein
MRCRGFSLIELSIVLLVLGLVVGVSLSLTSSAATDCLVATKAQLAEVERAIERYEVKHNRLPRPAMRSAGVEDPLYGRETPTAQVAAVLDSDASGAVLYGALPFQELALSPSFAGDCWANKFTYAVTRALTDTAAPAGYLGTTLGAIHVKKNASQTLTAEAAYVVVSHGPNAFGAVKVNYSDLSPSPNRRWCNGTTLESDNCDTDDISFVAAEYNDGDNAGDNYFDDVIIFKGKQSTGPINGLCDNSAWLGCAAGVASNDNAVTCGAPRTWHCDGRFGGTDDTTCAKANAPCAPPPGPVPPTCDPSDPSGGCYVPPAPPVGPGPVPPACDPSDPSGGCYVPPAPPVGPGPGPLPPACDPSDPAGGCYVPPTPTCDPSDPSGGCYVPPTPTCDPSDPSGGCYVPPTPPDPGPCCQPYWDQGYQCPDSCFEEPAPFKPAG